MIKLDINKSKNTVEDVLRRSVIGEGFEKEHKVPLNHVSKRRLQKQRQDERAKTTGENWFNFPATKQTEEIRKDLEVLQMRSALDPKRFYKHNDMKTLPKYFQVGRIVDTPVDFYSSRIPKKERKPTIVEELLVDAEFKKYTKRKYQEILQSDPKRRRKAQQHAKKLKKLKRK
ncbi:deoxynucleotidyltransferase terminal-interacting protein 2 [Planococcus citri]|uniref:deoxynucleotidyltransferase terminal-interacting protein 2 n=1 Tax=Planococcus citri TaxID=170843 RepID=UPI0031F87B93